VGKKDRHADKATKPARTEGVIEIGTHHKSHDHPKQPKDEHHHHHKKDDTVTGDSPTNSLRFVVEEVDAQNVDKSTETQSDQPLDGGGEIKVSEDTSTKESNPASVVDTSEKVEEEEVPKEVGGDAIVSETVDSIYATIIEANEEKKDAIILEANEEKKDAIDDVKVDQDDVIVTAIVINELKEPDTPVGDVEEDKDKELGGAEAI